MNAPPPVDRAQLLCEHNPLRRIAVADGHGLAIEHATKPEDTYLLELADHRTISVPVRCVGQWNAALYSGRHFFLGVEPEAALHLVSVRKRPLFVGRVVFPSGFAASPWFAESNKSLLMRRIQRFLEAFAAETLTCDVPILRRA